MSAPSTLFSNIQQRLSPNSQQLLSQAGLMPVASPPTEAHSADISDGEKLSLFDSILDEVEQVGLQAVDQPVDSSPQLEPTTTFNELSGANALFASVPPQALPQATEDIWQQAQPQSPAGNSNKERVAAPWSLDTAVEESGGMLATVEHEKQPEISPEVESYMQRVEDSQESPAQELAKLIPTVVSGSSPAPTEVVRVLPVTKATADSGHSKSPKFSIRWLVEWSDKVIKMFQGKAVYRT